jgi:hypothetical protein
MTVDAVVYFRVIAKQISHALAHTDGGVDAIRCLDQSVDEPPDSPARAPSRCLRAPTKASGARTSQSKVFPELGKQALAENL